MVHAFRYYGDVVVLFLFSRMGWETVDILNALWNIIGFFSWLIFFFYSKRSNMMRVCTKIIWSVLRDHCRIGTNLDYVR
jgi:hypothetical protein